jgi:hypothetical protein
MAPDLRQQLLGSPENAQYYDLNVYLSKLVCMSRMIDPEFQSCMTAVFSSLPNPPAYQAGPVKVINCFARVYASIFPILKPFIEAMLIQALNRRTREP